MAYYTHDGSGNRTGEAKGDIGDFIVNIDIAKTPLFTALARQTAKDIKPTVVEDSLATVDITTFFGQDANAPAAVDTSRALIYNWTQNHLKTAAVTDTQNAVAQYGMGKELLYQEVKKMKEWKRDIEAFILSDQARQEPTNANNRTGKMAGMSNIIASHTNTIGNFSQANFDTLLAAIIADGGNPRDCYMDAPRKIAVAAWTTNVVRNSEDIRTLVANVQYYESALGEMVAMHWHYLMPQDSVASAAHFLLLELVRWKLRELLAVFRKTLPDNGAGPSTLIKGELAPLCDAEQANGQFY